MTRPARERRDIAAGVERLARRVECGQASAPALDGEAVEAPASLSLPAHPTNDAPAVKAARAAAREAAKLAMVRDGAGRTLEVAIDRALEAARAGSAS